MQKFKILKGDCLEQLKTLPADYFDAVLSDPPYGLSFMGKEWDKGVPSAEVYEQVLRVSKPGAFGLHFGGTRTYHRLAVNIEDAGFEIRDCIAWLYGSGFPKSYNISKGIDKAAGAEREVVQGGSTVCSFLKQGLPCQGHGDANGRYSETVHTAETAPATEAAKTWDGWGTALKPAFEPAVLVMKPLSKNFVNNALTHGCGALNIEGCRVGTEKVAKLIKAAGSAKGTGNILKGGILGTIKGCELGEVEGRFPANLILDEAAAEQLDAQTGSETSRFFYTAKVSTKERNAGLDSNNHPTLKPLALTSYLAKLLLPPKQEGKTRRLLVPFSGAGSELIGALQAGWDEVIGIELDESYIEIARARIKHWTDAEEQ